MKNIETGGPAFPNPHFNNVFGMTLRDYFAAKAMQAMCGEIPFKDFDYCARRSYAMADEMIKACK